MKKLYSIAIFLLLVYNLNAQNGAPLLSNFKESNEIENQNWAICQDDNNVMLFANRRGILSFDGRSWSFISVPVIPYALSYNSKAKKVFVGGDNSYGYIARDEKGTYKYFSESGDSSRVGMITKIIFTDSSVYYYGEQSISRHNLKSGKLEIRLHQKENEPFTGMFITPKNTFINVFSEGLFRLESDTLFPIVTGYLFKDEEILFGLPYDKNLVLLGRSKGNLSLFDGIKLYDYQIKDQGYLQRNILSEGITFSDSLYAFSTLDGGALVVERKSGKVRTTINYGSGLPDDEVFALGCDNNNGLWFSHQYGLTRADMRLPVENFSTYPGLKGNLISSLWHKNELYVATSEGVYYLKEVKNYSLTEVQVKKSQEASNEKVPEVQKARKGIFSKIFGRKTKSPETQEKTPQIKPTEITVKRTESKLNSISYSFVKVEGLNEKCKQIVPAGDDILAATNKGLFGISDHVAREIGGNVYVNYISARSKDNKYYIATNDGYFYVIPLSDNKWNAVTPDQSFNHSVYSIAAANENTVWAGSDDIVFRISLRNGMAAGNPEGFAVKSDLPQRCMIQYVNDTLFLFAVSKVKYFNTDLNAFADYKKNFIGSEKSLKYVFSEPGVPWIKAEDEWVNISRSAGISSYDKAILKVFNNPVSINTDRNNIWVVNADNTVFRIIRNKISSVNQDNGLFIRSISNSKGVNFKISDIVFGRGDNSIYFDLVAPGYLKENSTQYQYIVSRVMKQWSKWSNNNTISLMILPGKYTLQVRAKDIWGNVSQPKVIPFTIKAPITQTTLFYLFVVCVVIFLVINIMRFRERKLKKDKQILETKVKERTAQIEAQKQEITSSIEYASRIQRALLPEDAHFKNCFSDYFIIFNPRDIVSGDFYWIGEDEKRYFFTVADCTGHGVPGAFMSTLGISTLEEIITNNENLKANTVLNLLRDKVKTSLHQTGKEGEAADGMDVAFCTLHKNKKVLEYSGAYNPLFIFQDGELKEYKADRMPIGIYYGEKESFTNYEIKVQKGDTLYIFSDGFIDQFGGPNGSKYLKHNLKKLLSEIYYKPMPEQRKILEKEFNEWKGTGNQIDDVTIIGVKI
jgi:serine phosphatase RsbU (regulator of sigma subunit)